MTEYTRIAVPLSTRDLLRQVADYEGVSMSELVTAMALHEAEAIDTSAPPDIGISIAPSSAGGVPLVALSMDDAPLTVFETDEARELARQIERTITARSRFDMTTRRGKRQVRVFRRGRGVVLSINDHERAFTTGIAINGVAAEIGRQLQKVATAAATLPEVSDPTAAASPPPAPVEMTPRVRETVEAFGLVVPATEFDS